MEQPENKPMTDIDAENSHAADSLSTSPWSGLGTRAISAAVLAAIFVGILWQGGWLFDLLVLIAAMLMVKEWNALTANDEPIWRVAGLFYAAIPCASFIWLRNLRLESDPNAGFHAVLYLVLLVCATDIGAYFTGRKFGNRQLAPVISPKKTWEGLGGGVALAAITGTLAASFIPFGILNSILLASILAIVAQGGDLFESWMKRRAGVKDSGSLIPGHGGMLDRVDGFVFTAPLYAWCIYLSGQAL